MTKRDLFSLALKILGVVYIILAAFSLIMLMPVIDMMFYHVSGEPNVIMDSVVMTVGYFVIILLCAYLLIKWGDRIAQKLVLDDSPLPGLGTREWEKPLFTLCLRVAGVFCLILVIPGIVYHPLHWISDIWSIFPGAEFGELHWYHFITDIVVVVLGFYLLRGGNHVVRYVFREPKAKPIESGPE